MWTDWQTFDKMGRGEPSCGEKWYFYPEQVKAVANVIPVVEIIFFYNIMTTHHGVGNTEMGLEIGHRIWCPASSVKQGIKSSEPQSTIMAMVLATLTFFFHSWCHSSVSMLLGHSLLIVGWLIVRGTISYPNYFVFLFVEGTPLTLCQGLYRIFPTG